MNGQRKIALSHDELLALFESDCNTFTDIAAIAGVTRERIRQIYNARFRDVLGARKSGRQRRTVCSRKRLSVAKQNAIPAGRALNAAIRCAERGINVDAVLCAGSKGVVRAKSLALRCNGHLCEARQPRVPRFASPSSIVPHYRVDSSALSRDFAFLIVLLPNDTLIIPRAVIEARFSGIRHSMIYIPQGGPSTYGRFAPVVDWWQYAERWDLLDAKVAA